VTDAPYECAVAELCARAIIPYACPRGICRHNVRNSTTPTGKGLPFGLSVTYYATTELERSAMGKP
jgi:hypothetical protein